MPGRDKFRYAKYPGVKLFDDAGNEIHHLLWGDWVRVESEPDAEGWVQVHVRNEDGWLREDQLQEERVLEVTFVDVGQGDGALIVTPDDEHIVVDAGVSENMYRYLDWRYAGFKTKWTFDAAVITHPDRDHYAGFAKLFEHPTVEFKHVFHNGIMEEGTGNPLGPRTKHRGAQNYLTGLIETQADLKAFLDDESLWTTSRGGKKQYPKLLESALGSLVPRVRNRIQLLSTDPAHNDGDGFMPLHGNDKRAKFRVLGPIIERDEAGHPRLRVFGGKVGSKAFNVGKTKNGHSILLMIEIGSVKILLGGDLNSPAEHFLLGHYTGLDPSSTEPGAQSRLIEAARRIWEADIAKCCHHGSGDFSDEFLSAVNPAATVISSGDEESHAHPRSDTLGAIGLRGRGWRPLILSTELVRSHREDEGNLREQIGRVLAERDAADSDELRDELGKKRDQLLDKLARRNVTTYGAINLRTDGDKVIMAYKLEKERKSGKFASGTQKLTKWDVYQLERSGNGPLTYIDS